MKAIDYFKHKVENGDITSEEALKTVDPLLAPGLYCIKANAVSECWIADIYGDPGRTHLKSNARTYTDVKKAERDCAKIRDKYPNRFFWVESF